MKEIYDIVIKKFNLEVKNREKINCLRYKKTNPIKVKKTIIYIY